MDRVKNETKNILIVDNDRDTLDAVSLLFRREGYNVATSLHSDTLLNLDGNRPDLILLDVRLSNASGYDLCRTLKERPLTKNIPIILFTALNNAHNDAILSGADGFIEKPFDIGELVALVKEHI